VHLIDKIENDWDAALDKFLKLRVSFPRSLTFTVTGRRLAAVGAEFFASQAQHRGAIRPFGTTRRASVP